MDDAEVDAVVMSFAGEHWRKVAMVIAKSLYRIRDERPLHPFWGPNSHDNGEAAFDAILERVKALVAVGRLAAQGDLSRPGYSEVRLASSKTSEGVSV